MQKYLFFMLSKETMDLTYPQLNLFELPSEHTQCINKNFCSEYINKANLARVKVVS